MKYGIYLVCKEHTDEVRYFLNKFFLQVQNEYSHDTWITFKIPNTEFLINLMEGIDQEITQNTTVEIYCESREKLEKFAKLHNLKIKSFKASKSKTTYKYYFAEALGPQNICKIEASYSQATN